MLTISAVQRRIRPSRGTVRTLTIVCPVDLETATLPVTAPARPAIYSDDSYSGFVPHAPKTWGGDGLEVTTRSFDGRRVTGTFAGELPPGTGGVDAPATVRKGRFRLELTDAAAAG